MIRRLIVALVFALACANTLAFTVTPKATVRPAVALPKASTASSTSLSVIVDPALEDLIARSDPIGSLAMFILVVSLWELYTPGRAKK